jgi:hypothetical protein
LQVVPWGFRKILRWINQEYNNPPVFITESGYSEDGQLNDTERILYHVVRYHNFRFDFLLYVYSYLPFHFDGYSGLVVSMMDYGTPSSRVQSPAEAVGFFSGVVKILKEFLPSEGK